jgi:hypothetical protein
MAAVSMHHHVGFWKRKQLAPFLEDVLEESPTCFLSVVMLQRGCWSFACSNYCPSAGGGTVGLLLQGFTRILNFSTLLTAKYQQYRSVFDLQKNDGTR